MRKTKPKVKRADGLNEGKINSEISFSDLGFLIDKHC